MQNTTKKVVLEGLICHRRAWYKRFQSYSEPLSVSERFRIEQGREIGERARTLYPDGVLVEEKTTQDAVSVTRILMSNPEISSVFEGAFVVGSIVARADILTRRENGWRVIEVKSGTGMKDEYVDDLAYTIAVGTEAGTKITGASLLLISKNYCLGMDDKALFSEFDLSEACLSRAASLWQEIMGIDNITGKSEPPEGELIMDCKDCEIFTECVGEGIEDHIFNLPRLSAKKKFKDLKALGVKSIREIPESFPLTKNQSRVRKAVLSEAPVVEDGLSEALAEISWPAAYLDFETVSTAIPLFPDTPPYTQIPTQYSIHFCQQLGQISEHRDFLSDGKVDPREELARHLIDNLEGAKSIVVYSNFERTIIKSLAEYLPNRKEVFDKIIDKFVDLEDIIRKHFYHPGFRGSSSIKRVLPALVPSMSYEHLSIADGNSAMGAFVEIVKGKTSHQRRNELRSALLEYCKRDTQAMVECHRKLAEYVKR